MILCSIVLVGVRNKYFSIDSLHLFLATHPRRWGGASGFCSPPPLPAAASRLTSLWLWPWWWSVVRGAAHFIGLGFGICRACRAMMLAWWAIWSPGSWEKKHSRRVLPPIQLGKRYRNSPSRRLYRASAAGPPWTRALHSLEPTLSRKALPLVNPSSGVGVVLVSRCNNDQILPQYLYQPSPHQIVMEFSDPQPPSTSDPK